MEELLRAERQEHLEQAVESEDVDQREAHRIVSRWIKRFLEQVVDEIRALDEEERHPTVDPESMSLEYMEHDSEGAAGEEEATQENHAG